MIIILTLDMIREPLKRCRRINVYNVCAFTTVVECMMHTTHSLHHIPQQFTPTQPPCMLLNLFGMYLSSGVLLGLKWYSTEREKGVSE